MKMKLECLMKKSEIPPRRTIWRLLMALAGLLLFAMAVDAAHAQAVYGGIVGTVLDPSGSVVPSATVTVTDLGKGTSVTVTSNEAGQYAVAHLISGTYRVEATAPNFGKATTNNVVVYVDTTPKVDLKLPLASDTESVTVTAGAPVLQAERADVSMILNERAVQTTPNLNRNLTAFELLTPGTTYIGWSEGESDNPQRSQQIEVNGQLPFATGYELDGTDNQEPIIGVEVINPNLEAISEMKVTSQNYDAEFGSAVAGLVTAQTKSGSNNLHGSAFGYRRSDAQQARDPFTEYERDSLTGKYIPSNLHSQFGGSLGGAIKKDKLFFFGDYQGLREKTGTATKTTVPTKLAHETCTSDSGCDLSDYISTGMNGGSIYQAYDPTGNETGTSSRTPFDGNVIPAGRLSAPAVNLLKLMPLPTDNTTIVNNYIAFGTGSFNNDQFDVRGDYQANSRMHLFGRYTRFNSDQAGDPYFGEAGGGGFANGAAGNNNAVYHSVAGGGDYALSLKWLTDFRFGWFHEYINVEGPDYDKAKGTELGIPNVNQGDLSLNGGLPQFNINVPNTGANGSDTVTYGTTTNQWLQKEYQFQFVNNWTRYIGNHNIKFGGDFRRANNHVVGVNNNQLRSGAFDFSASRTAGDNSSGLGYASFLLGDATTFNRTQTRNTNAQGHQYRTFFYAQDQWRIRQNITLNYGLRYELYTPEAVNAKGSGGLLDLNTGNIRIAGYGKYNNAMNVDQSYKLFAPRLGVQWQPHSNMVVRVGYGRTYGMGWSGNTFGLVPTWSFPTQVNQNVNADTSYAVAVNLTSGPPSYTFDDIPEDGNYALPDTIEVPTRPTWQRLPTLDAWNVAIEQQLGSSASLQISYVGSKGTHNMFDSSNQADPNTPTITGFTAGASTNDRRPYYNGDAQSLYGVGFGSNYGWTQSLRYNANQANTKYNALQVMLQKRYAHGFQLMSHYTWSRAQANESTYFFIDRHADWGNSYYNRPQVFVATGSWDLPVGKGQVIGGNANRLLDEIIGGFSVNATVTAQKGLPFTPDYSYCSKDEDVGICRPSRAYSSVSFGLGAGSLDTVAHNVKYFDSVDAMTENGQVSGPYKRPEAGTFGDIQRNDLFGPGLFNTDAAVAKKFNITQRVKAQFRAEAFNLFNHPNLGQPGTTVDASSGGYISDIVASQDGTSMRRLQFALRFDF
jgi:hypothetical protein